MSFQDDLMKAEAIREVRARGCTTPGVAELIVKYHGATHTLANLDRVAELGNELAASDTAEGQEMCARLEQAASLAATEKIEAGAPTVEVLANDEDTNSRPAATSAENAAGSAVDMAASAAAAGDSAASSESAASQAKRIGKKEAR